MTEISEIKSVSESNGPFAPLPPIEEPPTLQTCAPEDLTARLAGLARAMAAPLPNPEELAAGKAADKAMAERIHSARPGVPLHHAYAVLETLRTIQRYDQAKAEPAAPEINGSTSDGFHTFDELYHHRTLLFAMLLPSVPCTTWKSRLHEDGTMFPGFFIAGATTDEGEATYHVRNEYWDLIRSPEYDRAPAFDGHTPDDTLARLYQQMTGRELEVKP